MKKLLFVLGVMLLAGCSGEDPEPQPDPKPTAVPVAVDDNLEAVENEDLTFSSLLNNDTTIENARIYAIDSESAQGGTITDNRNNTYTYSPPNDFLGEDSFSYTICVPGDAERCSTAQVKVNVEDAGTPEANGDAVNAFQGISTTFKNLTANDNVLDGAVISSVSEANSGGSVVLNEDGSVTYTSLDDFTGEDTFTYSLCDNDQPEAACSTATVTVAVAKSVNFNIPAELQDYYSEFAISTNQEMNWELISDFTIQKHTTILSYGQRHEYLYDADEDPDNPANVILMYTGESRPETEYQQGDLSEGETFNTEHIYPQSRLSAEDAVTDLHHLRVADVDVNSLRSNHPFTEGSGEAKLINENSWYPGDEWKGDVARMVMYLNIRYGETFSKVGSLDLFLKWNAEDPVSAFELQRQEVIHGAQGNRNPFIDNPYLATLVWGGQTAENRWE